VIPLILIHHVTDLQRRKLVCPHAREEAGEHDCSVAGCVSADGDVGQDELQFIGLERLGLLHRTACKCHAWACCKLFSDVLFGQPILAAQISPVAQETSGKCQPTAHSAGFAQIIGDFINAIDPKRTLTTGSSGHFEILTNSALTFRAMVDRA
jgi:hypothetical protein